MVHINQDRDQEFEKGCCEAFSSSQVHKLLGNSRESTKNYTKYLVCRRITYKSLSGQHLCFTFKTRDITVVKIYLGHKELRFSCIYTELKHSLSLLYL